MTLVTGETVCGIGPPAMPPMGQRLPVHRAL